MAIGMPNPWQTASLPALEPEALLSVLSEASDIALVLSADGGILAATNNKKRAPQINVAHWIGHNLTEFLTEECLPKADRILRMSAGDCEKRDIELNHRDSFDWQFPVRYSVHAIGDRNPAILMLGQDLRQVAETQQQLVEAQLAIERGYEAQRKFDTLYRTLISATREAFVVISTSDFCVTDLNDAASHSLGVSRDELVGRPLSKAFCDPETKEEISPYRLALELNETGTEIVLETRQSRNALRLTPTSFRAGGERMMICRLEPSDLQARPPNALSENLECLFREGSEAIVFTDTEGVIKHANEAFLRQIHLVHQGELVGASLGDFLSRGQIDLNLLVTNTLKEGQVSFYTTQLLSNVGVAISIEIATTYLDASHGATIAFVIRDASRSKTLRGPAMPRPAGAEKNVVDLVGSTHLREIVAQTTNVIERMCIETAIELTGNNRAAAADLLGLSRQSLYVKLNKLGIHQRQSDG